jgi:predicted aldo/keto reductase-like oxidoreductase
LGKTGLKPTLLGMGTGTKASNKSSAQNRQGREAFVKTLVHAYERGVRYYDMADQYGAHDYMKDALKQVPMDRGQLMLLTKTNSREAEAVKADIDRFRQELDTDYLDVVLLHCLTEGNWTETLKPCMDVLAEAKEKGLVKAHGVSCHSLEALKLAADTPWVDVMLSRVNPYGVKMDAAPEEVTPVLKKAHESGKGMLGMKILGEGQTADKIAESLTFVLGLGSIDALTIGFLTPEEIDNAMDHIERIA